ncbi:putative voltage-dependent L-type calcium channel subunit beta-2 [Triplophysa rosa]|uniref:Voltage-dependent L-type calcium channel subunit beta-2 n=1 Tax=Triplophysa rosa TaxID=992332 RepID=A0A9W8CBU3_TRIRA|nr:putative voltage-dependent L-type calcium channel subunit beta-2 [Triplophysa rosa]
MRRTDGRGLSLPCARTSAENNREMFKTPSSSIEKHLDTCESPALQSHWRRVCRKGRLKSSDGSTASDSSFVRQVGSCIISVKIFRADDYC